MDDLEPAPDCRVGETARQGPNGPAPPDLLAYAQEPAGGVFHHTRQSALLTIEEKKILNLEARGCTRQQIEEALDIPAARLKHRITTLRKQLAVPPREPICLTAARMGFGSPDEPG